MRYPPMGDPLPPGLPRFPPAFASVLAATALLLLLALMLRWMEGTRLEDLPAAPHGAVLDLRDGARRIVAEVYPDGVPGGFSIRVKGRDLDMEAFRELCRGGRGNCRLLLVADRGTPWRAVGLALRGASGTGSFDRIEFATTGRTSPAPQRRKP